jgi:hypothetical protein
MFVEPMNQMTFVYYESKKRNLKKRHENEYLCDERLKTKVEESTCLVLTGLHEELEHLKIETRLTNENFSLGEYVI